MRRSMLTACLLAFACRPAAQGTNDAHTALLVAGKIPITTKSDDARALFLRGRTLNENLQPHEAYLLFQQSVALDPSFAFGEYSMASTAPTARDIAEHLQKALALADSASLGERLIIFVMQSRKNGDPERTRQLAESLVTKYPKDERAHWILATACSAQQMYDCSIAELRTALALNPNYSLAQNQLGYAYRSAGNMAAAESAFTHYIALVPNDPNPYDSYAELLMKLGRFDESIAQYRKAQSIDAHFTGSFTGIAADEMFAGRYDASIAESERYFKIARDDRERRSALLNLAITNVDKGATEDALRAMERSYAIARAIGDTLNMSADLVIIADILLQAGRIDAARDRFAQAHGLIAASNASGDMQEDDVLAAHYDAARIALARSDLSLARTEATAYANGAVARHNDTRIRQAHELNGILALAAKQFDASLAELAAADQQNPAVWDAKARAYAGRGDLSKAHDLAEQAAHMNILPTFPYVFTRASRAAAMHSATSGNAGGMPH